MARYELKWRLSPQVTAWAVNIKGHGCLIGALDPKDLDRFLNGLKTRPIPEPSPV